MAVITFKTKDIIHGIRKGDTDLTAWLRTNYLHQVKQFLEDKNWKGADSEALFERTIRKIKQQIQFNKNIQNRTFKDIFQEKLKAGWLDHVSSFMADALVHENRRNIYQHFAESIFPIVCSMVEKYKKSTALTPKEVFQEAIWRVGENIRKGKYTEADTFKSYFLAIVSNVLREEARKKSNLVSFDEHFTDAEDDYDFDAFMSKENDLTLLAELLAQADENCRKLFDLRFWKGMKIKEIAEQETLTLANAKQKLSRCQRKLKAAILNVKNNQDE